jgi:hypothetical protein
MLFMVIEKFRNHDAAAVYRRFREKGRMLPGGLRYVGSWVETNFDRCFQLMECDDERLFPQWIARWNDLVDFEIVAVRSSKDAAAMYTPRSTAGKTDRQGVNNCDSGCSQTTQ